MDAGGFVIDWNRQAERTFGWTREEAVGRVLAHLIIPERDRAAHLRGLEHYIETGEAPIIDRRLELSAVDRAGREFAVEVTISADPTPDIPRFYAFLHDISERKRGERMLRAQHAVAHVFVEAQSTDDAARGLLAELGAAMDWEFGAWWSPDEAGEMLVCRSVWSREPTATAEFEDITLALELPRGLALPGRAWETGEPAWTADLAADKRFPRAQAAGRAGLHASLCVPLLQSSQFQGAIEFVGHQSFEPDESTRQIHGAIATQITRFMGLLAQRSGLLDKLERLALTDDLTGLDNRRAWEAGLRREHARARREGTPLSVAMLDLDQFKRYNDAHGHPAGDELLREVAERWSAHLRGSDILARYGGEEFALLSRAWPIDAALTVVERLRACMPREQTCSAGLATLNSSETVEALVRRADEALYEAKERGRDRIIVAP